MQTHVYANSLEIASKAADGKSVSAFPDPCWSPPPPKGGPIVVPYPNTVFARDITNGTNTVFICNQEVAIEDQSYFATSTGNEPATSAFQKGVKTHVIKGKAYFQSWSFDVVFEGFGVPRHTDLTTHNHGSNPGNTPPNYYMDDPDVKAKCADDKKDIDKKCKPDPAQSEEDEKKGKPRKKKGGLTGALAKAGEALDDFGKTTALYKREKKGMTATDGNAWMEDHCTGLWITPSDTYSPDLDKKLTEMMEKIEGDRLGMMKKALDELKEVAIERAGEAAADKAFWFSVRTGVKAVVGALGVETVVITAGMVLWTVADVVSTAAELAELAGTKGKAALDAIMNIKDIGDKAKDILKDFKDNPHKVHANAMSLMAQLDPCTRARKCMLVPYQNTTGTPKAVAQANHGNGCCPGQTGHHVLPDSMVKDAGCPGYDKDMAPTICLEGTKNGFEHGSHGMAHAALSKSMGEYKKITNMNQISYADAKKQGLDAIEKAGAAHCDRKCLEAQLDKHYGGCKDKKLNATAGTGGAQSTSTTTAPIKNG